MTTSRLNSSVDCTTTKTIDQANAQAHTWRANLYNVSKYRMVASPNNDHFVAFKKT